MRTKLQTLIALLCMVSIASAAEEKTAASPAHPAGRYIVTVAPLWHPIEQASRATLVKVDTTSGRVWILTRESVDATVQGKNKVVLVQGWIELDKSYPEALQEVRGPSAPARK